MSCCMHVRPGKFNAASFVLLSFVLVFSVTWTATYPFHLSACVCRAMMNNPESLRQMLSPENMQAMLQMQQAMQQLQGTGLVPPAPGPGAAGLGTEGAFAFTACKSVLAVSGLARDQVIY